MEPEKKKKLQDKPVVSPEKEKDNDVSESWLEDMKDDLEDYMEEQGSQLRY